MLLFQYETLINNTAEMSPGSLPPPVVLAVLWAIRATAESGAVTDWSGGTADFQHSLDEIIKAICGRPWYAVIHNEIWKKTELTWILIWTKYIFEFNADVLETHFCSSEISYPYNTFSDISILSGNHGWSPFCFTHRDCKINLICFFIQFKA